MTLIVQARDTPVNTNQAHQEYENGWLCRDPTRAIPYVAHIIKHKSIGSKRMYWFRVNNPTSEKCIKKAYYQSFISS